MRLKLCLLLVLIITFSWAQTTKTFVANGIFPVPNGVTTINVSAWGGGGSGGGASGAGLLLGRGAAGGGGGAFASSTLTVTPGASLNVLVAGQTSGTLGANGSAGGSSTITGFESLFLAAGGSGGGANNAGGTPVGGTGGTVANSKGTVRLAGSTGGNGSSALLSLLLSSGAGGAGGNAGGAGGAALSSILFGNAPGNAGSPPGGGGSGAINSALGATQVGGIGARGQVIISYTCPAYNITSTTATNVCATSGTTSTVTLTSGASSLPIGNYVVTYNRSTPSATGLTASLTVSTAGTGVFTAVGLNTVGSSTITVTKIDSQSCSSTINSNNTATVTISPATVGGAVTGGTTINSGQTSGLLTLSGHTGSVVKWQSAVSPFTTWVDIANINTTYTSGVLTATTQFRAVVQSGVCVAANSDPTTVTVEDLPALEGVSAFGVCSSPNQQSTSLFYTVTNGSPVTYRINWIPTPANSFVAVTDAPLSPSPISITVPAGTAPGTYSGVFRVKNANGDSSEGSLFTVVVSETPTIQFDGIFSQVCANSSQFSGLTYNASSGNPTSYAIDWDNTANAASLTDIPNTPQNFDSGGGKISIQIPANASPGTYQGTFILNDGVCSSQYPVTITINPATVGGTVTGGTTINSGQTSGLLTLSGHTGSVVKWQSAVGPFDWAMTWVDIANTNTTYTSGVLTESTQFRAVVQSGACAVEYSDPTTVTVEELPALEGVSTSGVCSSPNQQSTSLFYTVTNGSPVTYRINWIPTPANSFAAVTDAPLSPSPITITVPAGTAPGTYSGVFRVKNANGDSSEGSLFTVTVNPSPTITTNGIFSAVCAGTSQLSDLTYSASSVNFSIYSLDWDDSANAAFLTDIPGTLKNFDSGGGKISIQIPANASPGTYQGTFILNDGVCSSQYPVTITINPATVGGTVTGGTTINSGQTSGLLTLSGHTGSVVKWQSAVSPFTTWVDIANANTTYTSGVLTATTQFRAVVQSGVCVAANSDPTTVTVKDLPDLEGVSAFGVCSSPNEQSTSLFYTVTNGSPVTYRINWIPTPANSFVAVTDAPLSPSPISITVPAGTAPGTYSGVLRVKNASGGSSDGSLFTIIVNETPDVTITTTPESSNAKGSILIEDLPQGNSSITINPDGTVYQSNAGSLLIDNLPSGTYTLEIVSDQGCTQILEVGIPYIFGRAIASEEAASANNTVSIASANQVINVESLTENIDEVFVYDISGNLIYKKEKIGDSKLVINNLTSGNQILIVKVVLDNNRTETKKVSY